MKNRQLTQYELVILSTKCSNWSYGNRIVNGMIELGNGEGDEVTRLLPYEILMSHDVIVVTEIHTLEAPPPIYLSDF